MEAPVWQLSVNLETKTAVFTSGLADAAKSARGAFNDIKGGSGEMGGAVSGHMMEARHGVMLLGEEFGIHLPRALTTFIASIGPIGAAMEAAFPFLAIAVGATLLLQHLNKMREAGLALTDDQMKFGTAVENAFNTLDTKIIQAQIRADELRKDHLGALRGELELIDRQSMAELVKSFETVAKASDIVFKDLKTSWYQFGAGSDGAKHALEQFQTQYDSLLAQGKDKDASGLLGGTLAQAQKVQTLLKDVNAYTVGSSVDTDVYKKSLASAQELHALGVKTGLNLEKDIAAQQQVVDALQAQVSIESRMASLKALEKGNATTSANEATGKDRDAEMRASIEDKQKQLESERQLREAATRSAVQEETRKEDAIISTSRQGSVARLNALRDAMAQEEALGLEGTAHYQELLKQRNELATRLDEEARKQRTEAAREAVSDEEKTAELVLSAAKQHQALLDSSRRMTQEQQIAEEQKFATDEYNIKLKALQQDEANLDTTDHDYINHWRQFQDQEKHLTQQHENELTAIREKAEIETNNKLAASYQQFTSAISGELSKSIMGHQSWAKMVDSLGDQMISSMIKNAIMYPMSNKFRQESDAKAAATAGFKLGMEIGGPAGPVLDNVFAAVAFAGAMAFEGGGVVPGIGRGDIVPAMLSPGEGIVPGGVMDGLNKMAREGGMGGGTHYHVHGVHFAPTVHALDSEGVDRVLDKHSA